MVAKFYRCPTGSDLFQNYIFTATKNITNYQYVKKRATAGEFSLSAAIDSELMGVRANYIIEFDGDQLIIDNIRHDETIVTFSGYDLKTLLKRRVSTPEPAQDESNVFNSQAYDIVSGTTAQCIKYFLDRYLISPSDSEREMPLQWESGASGSQTDSAMVRLSSVHDIVAELCDGAEIGYSVYFLEDHRNARIKLVEGKDHSENQSNRARVVFSAKSKNLLRAEFESDYSNLINAVYAENTLNNTIGLYYPSSVVSGIARREAATSISPPQLEDAEMFALEAIKDNVVTNSYNISAAQSCGYGIDWDVGDIVTVIDIQRGDRYNARVEEVQKTLTGSERNLSVTLGKPKQKLLNRIVSGIQNGTLRG